MFQRQSWSAVGLLFLIGFAAPAAAQDQKPDTPDGVAAGREALSRGNRFPWYDRRQDDVRRLNVMPRETEQKRDDAWTGQPVTTTTPRNLPDLSWIGRLLQWIGLAALVLLLGFIAFTIATAFLKEEISETSTVRKVVETRRDADRVEALPFHVRAGRGDFLAEARRLYEAGQYSDAIVYLFSHELIELDKRHVIRLAKGKTNRQYVRESRRRPSLAAVLELTMVAFEEAFFGHKSISRDMFECCWQRLDEFHGELDRLEHAAA